MTATELRPAGIICSAIFVWASWPIGIVYVLMVLRDADTEFVTRAAIALIGTGAILGLLAFAVWRGNAVAYMALLLIHGLAAIVGALWWLDGMPAFFVGLLTCPSGLVTVLLAIPSSWKWSFKR